MMLLPSLNRPLHLHRFFDSARRTGMSTPGWILLSEADYVANLGHYENLKKAPYFPNNWGIYHSESKSMVEAFTHFYAAWDFWEPHPTWWGILQDDAVPVSTGWDEAISAEIARGRHLITTMDNLCPGRWSAFSAVSDRLVTSARMGGIFPPQFEHLFVDDVWESIGRAIPGLWHHRADVIVEHRHTAYVMGRADATHEHGNGRGVWARDHARFQEWRTNELSPTVNRIKNALGEELFKHSPVTPPPPPPLLWSPK